MHSAILNCNQFNAHVFKMYRQYFECITKTVLIPFSYDTTRFLTKKFISMHPFSCFNDDITKSRYLILTLMCTYMIFIHVWHKNTLISELKYLIVRLKTIVLRALNRHVNKISYKRR